MAADGIEMNINPNRNRGAAVADHLHYLKVRNDPERWAKRKEQVNIARRAAYARKKKLNGS